MPSSAFYVECWSQIFALICWRLFIHTHSVCTHQSTCIKERGLADRSPLRLYFGVVICGGRLPQVLQGLITTCFNPGSTIKSLICQGITLSIHKRRSDVQRGIVSTQTRKAELLDCKGVTLECCISNYLFNFKLYLQRAVRVWGISAISTPSSKASKVRKKSFSLSKMVLLMIQDALYCFYSMLNPALPICCDLVSDAMWALHHICNPSCQVG